jgi:hypothetical protein
VGAAFASVVAVGPLGVFLASASHGSELPRELEAEVRFDDVDFVSDEELRRALGAAAATRWLPRTLGRMTIQRMDHVGAVVDELEPVTAHVVELACPVAC